MSWLSKTVKKAARSVKKHLGKHWWVPGYNAVKAFGELSGGIADEYKRNEKMYNTIALSVAGGLLTGGLAGAAIGATGIGGMTAASAAASGAVTGAVGGAATGTTAGLQGQQAEKLAAEQQKIAEEQAAEQKRLANLKAFQEVSGTPTEQTSLSYSGANRMSSQYRRNMVSRQNKKVGGSSSLLG